MDIPPEIGMLVNMKQLLLFDNKINTLPYEMGSMFQLEMLGIEGNPLQEDLKQEIMQNGTKALITHLRENAPGEHPATDNACAPSPHDANTHSDASTDSA